MCSMNDVDGFKQTRLASRISKLITSPNCRADSWVELMLRITHQSKRKRYSVLGCNLGMAKKKPNNPTSIKSKVPLLDTPFSLHQSSHPGHRSETKSDILKVPRTAMTSAFKRRSCSSQYTGRKVS